MNICFYFLPQCLLAENNNKYSLFKIQNSIVSKRPNWWAAEDIRETFLETWNWNCIFFFSEKPIHQISIEVDGSGNIGEHEQFHGKIWRLVLWYNNVRAYSSHVLTKPEFSIVNWFFPENSCFLIRKQLFILALYDVFWFFN